MDLIEKHAAEWKRQIISAGGDENVAQQTIALAALNGLFDPHKQLDQAKRDLRRLAVRQHVRMAYGGSTVNNGRSCAVCMGEWADDAPEFHAETCPLFCAPG